MDKYEPKFRSNIVVRPAYKENMEIYKTSCVRWVGELYINSKKIYTSGDYDTEDAAFNSVSAHIYWYGKTYGTSIFIDANMDRLRK